MGCIALTEGRVDESYLFIGWAYNSISFKLIQLLIYDYKMLADRQMVYFYYIVIRFPVSSPLLFSCRQKELHHVNTKF